MAYSINITSDSASGYNVSDGTIRDDYFSITLIGKGVSNYGALVQENIVHVMENFSHTISPPNPLPGQLWHNSNTNDLYMWQAGGGWIDLRQPIAGRIFDTHINTDAKIALSKLAPTIPARIIVGNANASAIPTYVDMTGDVLIDATGNMQIQSNTINTTELGSIINQDMVFGDLSTSADRYLHIIAHDSNIANMEIHGASQGSGRLFVGESTIDGGGIMFNGDNSPALGGTVNYTSFYRRSFGTETEVFRYSTISDQVDFHGEITTPRIRTGIGEYTFLEDGKLQLQANGTPFIELRSQDGGSPYIDFSTSLSGDYGARLQLVTDEQLNIYGADLVIGSTTQAQDTQIRVTTADANIASLEAYGSDQGTGMLYLGQSLTYGGGIMFNGDDTPNLVGSTDNIAFLRRSNGVDYEVFKYSSGNSDVYFNADIQLTGELRINDTNTRVTEGTGNSIRHQTNSGYVDIGPQNATWSHFNTDRSGYAFDKKLNVNANIEMTGELIVNDTNTRLFEGGGNSVRIQTNTGYVDIGSQSSSWCHMNTDRAGFAFDKKININGNIELANHDIENIRYLNGQYGNMMQSTGEWLYVNNGGEHSSGIYCGSSILRTDGEIQVGSNGGEFRVQANGDTTINGIFNAIGQTYLDNTRIDGTLTFGTSNSIYNSGSWDLTINAVGAVVIPGQLKISHASLYASSAPIHVTGGTSSSSYGVHSTSGGYGVYGNATSASGYGVYGVGPTGVYGYGSVTAVEGHATSLFNSKGGRFYSDSTTTGYGVLAYCNGSSGYGVYGSGGLWGVYAAGAGYGPFTGAHDGLIDKVDTFEVGDIILDNNVVYVADISNAIFHNILSTGSMNKNVVGVFVSRRSLLGDEVTLPASITTKSPDSNDPTDRIPIAGIDAIITQYDAITFNALGEGLVNVCGENGDIEAGDYICTSSIPGKGMKQPDDLLHNYTVAKSRESMTFSSTTEVKQIACIYVCG